MKQPKKLIAGICAMLLFSSTQLFAQVSPATFTNANSRLNNAVFHSGLCVAVCDVNGDGLDDIVRLSQGHDLYIEYQRTNQTFNTVHIGDFGGGSAWGMSLGDVDHNGYKDVLEGGSGCKLWKIGPAGAMGSAIQISTTNFFLQNANFMDVNGGWSVNEATDAVAQLVERFGIDTFQYIEQPVATVEELRELKLPIPVVGDEVIRKAKDPFAVDLNGAVDILMLKVSPLGGIERSRAIAAHHKLPVVVSSALESAVGIAHGLKLAAALPELKYACGLGTGKLLANDVADLPIVDGRMKVSTVNPSGMLNLQAVPERITWWENRIRDSFEVWQARN